MHEIQRGDSRSLRLEDGKTTTTAPHTLAAQFVSLFYDFLKANFDVLFKPSCL